MALDTTQGFHDMTTNKKYICCAATLALTGVAIIAVQNVDSGRGAAGRKVSVRYQTEAGAGGGTMGKWMSGDRGLAGHSGNGMARGQSTPGQKQSLAGKTIMLDGGDASPFAGSGATRETTASRGTRQGAAGKGGLHGARDPNAITRASIQKRFGEFFERNSLSKEQKAVIMAIYAESSEETKKLLIKELGLEENNRVRAEQRKRREEILRESLGDELYESLYQYNHTTFQRNMANALIKQFDAIGAGITLEKKDELVWIFYGGGVTYYDGSARESTVLRNSMIASFIKGESDVFEQSEKILDQRQMAVMRQFWDEIKALPTK
jgi:hypothetical protein